MGLLSVKKVSTIEEDQMVYDEHKLSQGNNLKRLK